MDAAKKYEYIKTLGEGSYGHVWLCRDRERDCLVAIKKFKDANKDSQAYHLAMREIKLLRATTHEHVVSVIEAFRSQSSGNVYLVMEYADSCLNLELKKHRSGLPPADVMRITWQLASALQYLHSRKIIHRDLKPANILLTAAGDLKLCDFGFARDLPAPGQAADMSSYVTTRWYRAPEVVVGADYGAAVDIWALGCLFAELLNGQPLFPGASNMDQLALIVACFGHLPNRLLAKALTNPHLVGVQLRTGNPRNWAVALQQRFAPYGEAAVTLLLACLNPDPLKRATADEVMRMAYFEPYRAKRAASQPATAAAAAGETPPAATPAAPATAAATLVANGAAAEAKDAARREPSATPEPKRPVQVAEPQPERPAARKTEEQPAAPAVPAAAAAPAPAAAAAAAAVAPSAAGIPAGTLPPSEPASVRMGSGSLATAGSGASSMDLDGSGPAPAAAVAAGPAVAASATAGPMAAIRSGIPSVVKMHSEPHLRVEPQQAQHKPAVAPPAAAATAAPAPAPSVSYSAPHDAAQAPAAGTAAGTTVAPGPASAAAAAVSAAPQASQPQPQPGLQPQPPVSVQPVRASNSMRASSSNIPLPTGAPLVRPTTDSGAAHLQDGQVPPIQGKAGSTLAQHKRASEANLGGYGSQRGTGATADVPVRIARVSMINPGGEAVQYGGNVATTPTGSAAVAGGAGAISPAGSFGGASSGMGRAPNHRRRSTATGSRLTRMSHTCEGQDSLLREEDSEEDNSAGKLPTVSGSMVPRMSSSGASGTSGRPVGSRASPGMHLQIQAEQQGPGAAAQHPSPRRYSRLSSVTEPGAQPPPGMDAAGGGAGETAAGQGGLTSHPHTGRAPLQAYSPLGRQAQWSTSGVAGTPSVPAAAAVAAAAAAAAHSAAAAAASQGHQGQPHGPGAGHHPASIHPGMHSVASAAVLNVSGPDRNGGEVLRSNVQHNIPTPAAPTAAMRSFTSAHVSTPAAAAAAAGLMSRPVSNLYINVDQGKGMDGSSSAESSPRSGGTTPSGNVAMPPPNAGRRQGIAEGPNSIFRSMLRSLSTRRTSGASVSSNASGEQHSGTPTAAGAGGIPAQQGSIGGAPTGGPSGHAGVGPGGVPLNPAQMLMGGHSQSSMGSSAGVSPFIPSRASSNNFIAGGPAGSADSSSSTASLTAPGGVVHGVHLDGAQGHVQGGGGAGLPMPGARRSMTGAGHGAARIGLPQLSVHANGVSGGAGAGINGYGSAVVSPAGRRRGAEVAQPMRMSDAGINAGSHSVLAMAASLKQAVGMQQVVEAVPAVEAGAGGNGHGHGHVGMRPMPPTDGAPGRLVQNSRSMREHGQ